LLRVSLFRREECKVRKTAILTSLVLISLGALGYRTFRGNASTTRAQTPQNEHGAGMHEQARAEPSDTAVPSSAKAASEKVRLASSAPTRAKHLSSIEERVLAMYDQIASALADDSQSCDVLGEKLAASVEEHASDLNRWSQLQKDLEPSESEADRNRLLQAAGPRMQAAQDAIRRSMSKCLQSEAFQDALRDLATLGTPG
jgi:hypothetical protein